MAPKRGRRERQAVQRERVLAAATALIGSEGALSVANVVRLAGIGRNTFYEYFDDVEHAFEVDQRARLA